MCRDEVIVMRKTVNFMFFILVSFVTITGCSDSSYNYLEPLMGMEWFMEYEEVKESFSEHELIEEREKSDENGSQKMQDYTDLQLFDVNCDLTLCFTDSGLIGFNYHDVEKSKKYQEWFALLEKHYGYPTEEGNGMSSWYDNPLGKNTAVYLFNLQEGVQISFYASSNTPDKSYEKEEEVYIPTPEIRTPIIPVVEEPAVIIDNNNNGAETTMSQQQNYIQNTQTISQNTTTQVIVSESEETVSSTTTINSSTEITTSVVTTAEITTEAEKEPINLEEFKLNGLEFYGSPSSEIQKMKGYSKTGEYKLNESELIIEYTDVQYCGKSCDTVLCFTNLGLVGINYFDENASNYSDWVNKMKKLYGDPFDSQYDYTAWYNDSMSSEIMIYVLALEDGVQISFYADDTGA